MRPIEFKGMNGTAAKHQPEYRPLPMLREPGRIVSCWQLSPEEQAQVAKTGVVWLSLMQPDHQLIVPSLLQVDRPEGLPEDPDD